VLGVTAANGDHSSSLTFTAGYGIMVSTIGIGQSMKSAAYRCTCGAAFDREHWLGDHLALMRERGEGAYHADALASIRAERLRRSVAPGGHNSATIGAQNKRALEE